MVDCFWCFIAYGQVGFVPESVQTLCHCAQSRSYSLSITDLQAYWNMVQSGIHTVGTVAPPTRGSFLIISGNILSYTFRLISTNPCWFLGAFWWHEGGQGPRRRTRADHRLRGEDQHGQRDAGSLKRGDLWLLTLLLNDAELHHIRLSPSQIPLVVE